MDTLLNILDIYNFLNSEDTVGYNQYVERLINLYNITDREEFIHYVDRVFSEIKWMQDNNIEEPDDNFIKNLAVYIHRNGYNWSIENTWQVVNRYKLLSWTHDNTTTHLLLSNANITLFEDYSRMLDAGIEGNVILGREEVNFENYQELAVHLNLPHPEIELQTNNNILDFNLNTARFSNAMWYNAIQCQEILLAGCGGIGSYVAFLLSRLKPLRILLFDPDKVEEVNMAGQLYSHNNIGMYKVDAMNIMARNYSNYYSTFSFRRRIDKNSETSDIMICGFDNMAARKLFFEKWVYHVSQKPEEKRKNCLFIDGRLAAEEFQVFCITGDDTYNIQKYKQECLFTDAEADETPCSYKQTTFIANMIGSVMVNLLVNFIANTIVPDLRALPFFTSYNASTMTLGGIN